MGPNQRADNTLNQALHVGEGSYRQWYQGTRQGTERIRLAESQIIVTRTLRENTSALVSILDKIVANCECDRDDIREEISLPTIIGKMADALEEYVALIPHNYKASMIRERIAAVETMVAGAVPELQKLYQRMLSNDGDDMAIRAQIVSRIFGSK